MPLATRSITTPPGPSAVVLDVNNGEILALASVPDFDPSLFVGGVDSATFQALNDDKAFNNLAVSGLYPPASTFKVVTYVSAIEDNLPLAEENLDPSSGRDPLQRHPAASRVRGRQSAGLP